MSCNRRAKPLSAGIAWVKQLGVLRTQPLAGVPRSFALPYAPPVMASAERRVSRLLRSMQVATAAAALVLVALVGVNIAQGPSTIPSHNALSTQQQRTSPVENNDTTVKTGSATLGTSAIVPTAPSNNEDTQAAGLAPTVQPSESLTTLSTAPPAEEQASGGRSALEWALFAMSGFTGVLALAVVAATWLPRRPV